jgi:hypothetical protein
VATATAANGNQLGFEEFRHSACVPPALTTLASSAFSLTSTTGDLFHKKGEPLLKSLGFRLRIDMWGRHIWQPEWSTSGKKVARNC